MGWENSSYFDCRSYYYDSEPPTPLEDAYIRKPKFYDFSKAKEYNYKTSYNESIHPVFGIKKSSSMEEFKEVYRQMILEHHPDKENGSHDKFIKVQTAWEELKGHP